MKQELQPHEKAARVIRLMGWLGILAVVAIAAAVLIPLLSTGQSVPTELIAVGVVSVAVPISLFVIAQGIFARRVWARWAGMTYGVVALFGIPIGTIVGVYVLWQLQKGWQEARP